MQGKTENLTNGMIFIILYPGDLVMTLFGKRKARREREDLLRILSEKAIRYVARRQIKPDGSTEEVVLGKGGRISCRNGVLMVDTGQGEVFRCPAEEASWAELLSRDGAVIKGVNAHTGEEDTVVAYYVYFR